MAAYENPAKVNGFAHGNDQFLAAGMEMFTLTTGAGADMTNKYVMDAVIQTISTVCAPVLLGTPTSTSLVFAMDRKGLPVAGAGAGNYTTVQDKIVALGNNTVGITFNADGTAATYADFTTGCSIASGTAYGE